MAICQLLLPYLNFIGPKNDFPGLHSYYHTFLNTNLFKETHEKGKGTVEPCQSGYSRHLCLLANIVHDANSQTPKRNIEKSHVSTPLKKISSP